MPGLADACGVCKKKFPFSLPRCTMCHKAFCSSCGSRVGGATFCSRACGHSFFYGSVSDVDEPDPEDSAEDE